MEELISRQQAIDVIRDMQAFEDDNGQPYLYLYDVMAVFTDEEELPTIQPEPHEIGYDDCANALLKMWMDNVLTDGEYYRIANKLNVKWGKTELPEPYKGVTE